MDLPCQFGKYELIQRIATGGMAEVYLARSFGVAGFEKRLVIKRIRPDLAEDPRFIRMFIHEAKISVHLNHPNVVQVYELGRVSGTHYMAMEHLHGKDLTRLVKTLRAHETKLPLSVACWVVAEALRGLSHAHGQTIEADAHVQLVHQDVSPHNILVTFGGDVKVVDFGIARLVNTAEAAQSSPEEGSRRPGGGKYAYMSPEQALGQPVDHRTDVFSAGIVLWELIVGHRLFQHPDPAEKLRMVQEARVHRPDEEGIPIDDALWAILSRALARDRNERYAAAALFEEDLRAWLFEQRHRVGRREVRDWMCHAFPEEADAPTLPSGIERLVTDMERLERHTETQPTPSSANVALDSAAFWARMGERKRVAVVLIDVDGLTELSARVEPERLWLRRLQLLRWVRRVVDRFSGRLHQVVDDHITLLFGIPRTQPDDAVRAIECAMELQRLLPEIRAKSVPVDFAYGVHVGDVAIQGRSGHRINAIAVGNTTRLARRLSAAADHGEMLISESVMALVEGAFILGRGPQLHQRGGRPPLASLRVEGRAAGLRIAHRGPWIRRGRELEVLRRSTRKLARGRGAGVLIHGETGTGKTRLIREIGDLARRREIPFYSARCAARHAHRPVHALVHLVRQILGLKTTRPTSDELPQLERLSQLGLSQRDLESIRTLFGIPTRHPPDDDEVWRALARVFEGVSREHPCILVLDEAGELAPDHQRRLGKMIAEMADVPALWILSMNGGSTPEAFQALTAVRLERLERDAQKRLIESLLKATDVEPALLDLVEKACEANPLYIEEFIKYLLDRDQVAVESQHVVLRDVSLDGQLPHTLAALVGARIDALDAAAKGILQLASLVGETFPVHLVTEAAGLDNPEPVLATLVSHGLVVRQEHGQWSFASALVYEGTRRAMLAAQRRSSHAMIAAAIEALYADDLDDWQEALARHCQQGGRPIDAARYAFRASQLLEQKHQLNSALELVAGGLATLKNAERTPDTYDARTQGEATLQLHAGRLAIALGDVDSGHHALQIALDISSSGGMPWVEVHAHTALGLSYLELSRWEIARAHLDQAKALLRVEPDEELEQQVIEALASLAFETGQNEQAESLWRKALDHSQGEPAASARCRLGLASRYIRAGRHDEARPLLDEALANTRTANDRILEGRVLNNIGLLHSWSGEHKQALEYFRYALEIREGIGYVRGVVVNHHNIGDTHFQMGEFARAYVAFKRSQDLALEMGWPRGVALNDIYLAYLEARNGESGLDRILEATEVARGLGDAEVTTAGGWLAGRFLAENEAYEDARVHLKSAADDARNWGLHPMVEMIESTLSDLG